MTFLPQPRQSTAHPSLAGDPAPHAQEGRRRAQDLCHTILSALERDDRLRREYVRLRWHGLLGSGGREHGGDAALRLRETVSPRPQLRRRPFAPERRRRPAKLVLGPWRPAQRLSVDDPRRLGRPVAGSTEA